MLKNSLYKKIIIASLTLTVLLLIYFIPINKSYDTTTSYQEYPTFPIYLLNENNQLTRLNLIMKETNIENQIKENIQSLTINSPKNYLIPDGLTPLIPENTTLLDFSLTDKILKLNFSSELLNISENQAESMIESIIYTLLEHKEIDSIMIFVNGTKLNTIPHTNQAIPNLLDKNFGINKIYNLTSVNNTSMTTIYYLTNINNQTYYVPVTLISNDSESKINIIIKELQSASIYHTNLMSFLNENTKVLDYQILENSINISFNNNIIADFYDQKILEEVKYAINLSLRDSLNIEEVSFFVNGSAI